MTCLCKLKNICERFVQRKKWIESILIQKQQNDNTGFFPNFFNGSTLYKNKKDKSKLVYLTNLFHGIIIFLMEKLAECYKEI